MSAILDLRLPDHLVERLGWVLVHSIWQFAAVSLFAVIAMRAMQRCSAETRSSVLIGFLAVITVCPVVTWRFLPAASSPMEENVTATSLVDSPESPGVAAAEGTVRLGQPLGGELSRIEIVTEPPLPPTVENPGPGAWTRQLSGAVRPWLKWAVAFWAVGALLCALRPAIGWCSLWRLKRVGVQPPARSTLASLHRVCQQLGVTRPLRVLESSLARTPVVVGYLRPVILLPASLVTCIPTEQLEAILAHELAHIRRHDFVVNLLQVIVETVFFYHPAVWWLSHRIRVEREYCCDDLVVRTMNNRADYGRALIAVAESCGKHAALALGASDGSLLARIRRLAGQPPRRHGPSAAPGLSVFAVLLGGAVAGAFVAGPTQEHSRIQTLLPSSKLNNNGQIAQGDDALTEGTTRPQGTNQTWVQTKPERIEWTSRGSAEVLPDNSIQLRGAKEWQDFTLYFRPRLLTDIQQIRLEVLPSANPQPRGDKKLMLFDVKPRLENDQRSTTQLEFQHCRFPADDGDDTAENCIDFLSDTGWTVPEFVDSRTGHELLLEFDKAVPIRGQDMFALTIDSGGAPELLTLSRVRISICGTRRRIDEQDQAAISPGTRSRTTLNGVPFEFRWCPPGEFLMGCPPGTEPPYGDRHSIPQHRVTFSRGCWMGETEITQAQYEAVVGSNPSFSRGGITSSDPTFHRDHTRNNPVEQVSWNDAVRFCKRLSRMDQDHNYRLPTEEEWEYACRAGTTGQRYGTAEEVAWVFENTDAGNGSIGHMPVARLKPNPWGLYDMLGNVSEWCSNKFEGPEFEQAHRVHRGDDCFADAGFRRTEGACTANTRIRDDANRKSRTIGFRIVRESASASPSSTGR